MPDNVLKMTVRTAADGNEHMITIQLRDPAGPVAACLTGRSSHDFRVCSTMLWTRVCAALSTSSIDPTSEGRA